MVEDSEEVVEVEDEDYIPAYGPNSQMEAMLTLSDNCLSLKGIETVGPDVLASKNPWGAGEVGVKHIRHMAQNLLHNQF